MHLNSRKTWKFQMITWMTVSLCGVFQGMVVQGTTSPELPCHRKYILTLKLTESKKSSQFLSVSLWVLIDLHVDTRHQTWMSLLKSQPPCLFETGLSIELVAHQGPWGSFFLCLPKGHDLKCALAYLAFLCPFWRPNSGPQACLEWTLPTEPFSESHRDHFKSGNAPQITGSPCGSFSMKTDRKGICQ